MAYYAKSCLLLFFTFIVHSQGFPYDKYHQKWSAFTGAILTFINNSTNETYTCSPFAAAMATRMLARGCAKDYFNNPNIPDYFDVTSSTEQRGDQYLIKSLSKENTTVKIQLFNQIYVKKDLIVNPNYAAFVQVNYGSEIKNIDFSNPNDAAGQINYEYKKLTVERVENIISNGDIGNDTDILLVSVLDFKAKWEFNFRLITYKDFFVDGDWSKRTKFMKMVLNCVYDELPGNRSAKYIKLQYRGKFGPDENTFMVIVIPEDHRGHKNFNISSLTSDDFKSKKVSLVLLQIPSFKIETIIDVKNVLNGINIPTFSDNNTDFSGITNQKHMNIKFIQKSTIHFHNEGTSTLLENVIDTRPDGPYAEAYRFDVLVDHPFFVLIIKDDVILQVVRVIKPESQFYKTEW